MNGANIGSFDLNSPTDTESMGLTDDRIRSVKSTLQQVIDDEHNFPSGGGSGVGYHRFGSARAYFGPESTVSSSGTDGRLMVTSNGSRLYHVGSGGTCLLGAGPSSLALSSHFPSGTAPQRHIWEEEVGFGVTTSTGSVIITTGSAYSGAPWVFLTQRVASGISGAAMLSYTSVDGSTFHVRAVGVASSVLSDIEFVWRSLGSRVL